MALITRVGDIGVGTCCAHDSCLSIVTTFQSGAPSVQTEGQTTCTLVTVGVSTCGHTSIAATVSGTVNAEGNGVHRNGDTGILPGGTYTVATNSATVDAGN